MSGEVPPNINIKEPRWDQSTFVGRANHFFTVTDPRNILLTNEQLENARKVVHDYRQGIIPAGLTENELWRAKYVYDSAFHPDTGEKMILIGRMSAQVPMNMTITGCMMTFYRTTPAVLFWQWINQSFNAVVNYTNRSGDAPLTVNELGTAYVSATTGAVATALGLNALTKRVSPLIGRFVPFAAVAAANCINIPLMRQRELKVGIPVTDENGTRLGESTNAAKQAITQVVISRILMAAPGMAIPPFIMNTLEKKAFLKRFPWMSAPIQVTLVGFCLVFATPLCCALFPQKSSMSVTSLEDELQASIQRSHPELRRWHHVSHRQERVPMKGILYEIAYPVIVAHSIIGGSSRLRFCLWRLPLAEKVKAFLADPRALLAAALMAAATIAVPLVAPAAPAKTDGNEAAEGSDEDMGFGL
ncbi:sideroflexin 1 [Cricetulus griseus]